MSSPRSCGTMPTGSFRKWKRLSSKPAGEMFGARCAAFAAQFLRENAGWSPWRRFSATGSGTAPELAATGRGRMSSSRKESYCLIQSLVLHAKDDTLIDVSHAERNARACRHSTLRMFDHGGHNALYSANR